MSFLTGKPAKQTASSSNQAYGYLKDALSPNVSAGTNATSQIASLLGGNTSGLDAFEKSGGYQNLINAGTTGIEGNAAARGLLRSGATGKSLVNFGQQTAQNYYNNYLQNLLGLSQIGNQSAGIIGNAGNVYNSTSKGAKPGLAGALGSVASAIPGVGTAVGAGLGMLGGGGAGDAAAPMAAPVFSSGVNYNGYTL